MTSGYLGDECGMLQISFETDLWSRLNYQPTLRGKWTAVKIASWTSLDRTKCWRHVQNLRCRLENLQNCTSEFCTFGNWTLDLAFWCSVSVHVCVIGWYNCVREASEKKSYLCIFGIGKDVCHNSSWRKRMCNSHWNCRCAIIQYQCIVVRTCHHSLQTFTHLAMIHPGMPQFDTVLLCLHVWSHPT